MSKRNSTAIGVVAGGKIAAKRATNRVRSTDTDLGIGFMAATGTEFGDEHVDVAVSSTNQADGNVRSPLPPSSSSNLQMVGPEPVNTPALAAVSLLDIMAATQKMANSAYGNVSDIHYVSGTSTRRAEIEAGAEGKAVANLSRVTNVKDEDVTVVVKARLTDDDKKAYADSLTSMLHDYTDNYYEINENSNGLILSNNFDRESSKEKFGEKYNKLFRCGGNTDRKQVKELLDHLKIKVIGDHENVRSEDLPEYVQDFKEDVIRKKATLIFVVVMSHGGRKRPDTVLMDDLEEVCAWKDIIYPLGDNDELREIPKIFLFNMCRDSWEPGMPKTAEFAPAEKAQSDSADARCQRSLRDSLVLFSTLPYDISMRDPYTGSAYISEMYKIFMKYAHKHTLRKMLYDVHTAVLENHGQTPGHQTYLFKNIKFKTRRN